MTSVTEKTTATSVLDRMKRPLHDLRISVTDRCNFRCTYCMPAEVYGDRYEFLPKAEILTYEEIARVAQVFVRLGVRKIRLTGGEPLVREGVERLVAMLAQIEGVEDLAMTTNGYLLASKAQALKDAGLHRITVSLDTLDDEIFGRMNGRGFGVQRVLEGIEAAETAGLSPVKIDAVVQRGVNDQTVVDLARRFKSTGHIVRFIEYMDVGNVNGWSADKVVPSAEVVRHISEAFPAEPAEANYYGEVAERWRYLDGSGEFGVISSVTQPFCATCTRARLSPKGEVYTCLFGTQGRDLRGPLRSGASDAELERLLAGVWASRTDRYSEQRASLRKASGKKIEMYQIGG
ncbi:MAG: GTP 3',8-cyclase MoaA [Chloroflexi bacterium]|nr:GTP 3',8-cyclase MoaA [Chloroflexota bacterium]